MIGWAIVLNVIAMFHTGMMVSFGGATSAAMFDATLEAISAVILIFALKRRVA